MANKGLIVGRVYMPGRARVARGAAVAMTRLASSEGGDMIYSANESRKYIYATANEKGEFAIPFIWSGADHGSGLLYAWATLVARIDFESRSGRVQSSTTVAGSPPIFVKLGLIKDVAGLLNTAGSSFKSVPEALDFALDLHHALRKFKTYPVWKSLSMTTTETWLLCGGVEIELSA